MRHLRQHLAAQLMRRRHSEPLSAKRSAKLQQDLHGHTERFVWISPDFGHDDFDCAMKVIEAVLLMSYSP